MIPTVDDLIELNNKALAVLNGSFQSLKASLVGKDPDEKAEILARMSRVNTEIQITQNVLIHLHAAQVTVDPITSAIEEELDSLAKALDDAIMTQAWINASLDFIQTLVDAASQVRKLTEANSSV